MENHTAIFSRCWNRNAQIAALRSVQRELETILMIAGAMGCTEKTQRIFSRFQGSNLAERMALYTSIKKITASVEKMVGSSDYDTDIQESLRSLLGGLYCIEGEGDANLSYMAKCCEDALHDACIEMFLTDREEDALRDSYDGKEFGHEIHAFSI